MWTPFSDQVSSSPSHTAPLDAAISNEEDKPTTAGANISAKVLRQPQDFPAIFHVAALGAVLLPVALAPCLFMRRSFSTLHRRLDALEHSVAVAQRASALEVEMQKEAVRVAVDRARGLQGEVGELREELGRACKRGEERDAEVRRAVRGVVDEQADVREKLGSGFFVNMWGRKPSGPT
ncbi:hypothetical protein CONPUDRAFT_80383 [Coniophora puteana RWD-64-598 SS2]|uniref:Uncharacterized protein n=1 Tax=Coniophora puteana (strain RWD-64-598) TaxID=741705 RepID=A0A5M3MXJ1_CONPW|nr:uncharacterized protein CONPUDRAFT_80383 [Coniophora puteana RWD-64-598 SS2]EIW83810.1 hypothetical protein CONPUDRAFT_80383 [Coniophora puteana RWD-64-598 SS2]